MSTRTRLVLAAALFALTVLVRAPASWLLGAMPAAIECQLPAGSIWRGACRSLQLPGAVLYEVSWRLHPWSLLRARLELDLRSADERAPGTVTVALGPGGRLELRDLRAELPIDAGFLPLFPRGWSGQLQLALDEVEYRSGQLAQLRGTATARSLAQRHPAMPLGSYELNFPATPAAAGANRRLLTGALRDLGGPLAVSGALTIRGGREYELAGLVAARPEAVAELAQAVEFLGPSDAQGRRSFSLSGTF